MKDLYTFDEVTRFEHLPHLESRKERCPLCNKKMLMYYNEDHEMFINICENKSCGHYNAQVVLDPFGVSIDLKSVILPGYNN